MASLVHGASPSRSFRPSDRPATARLARERADRIRALEKRIQSLQHLTGSQVVVDELRACIAAIRAGRI